MKEVEWKFELNVDYAQNFKISLCDESLFLWKIMSLKGYVYSYLRSIERNIKAFADITENITVNFFKKFDDSTV